MGDQKQEISDILDKREMKQTDGSGALSSLLRAEGERIGHPETQDFCSIHELTEKQRSLALNRYRQIEPFLEGNSSLKKLCQENNLPIRTAKSWVSGYRKYGLAALARKPRKDKGKLRNGVTPELRLLIEGLYLKNSHLSFSSIYKKIKHHQEIHQLPYPKYRTVCGLLSDLPKPMTILEVRPRSQPNWVVERVSARIACKFDT